MAKGSISILHYKGILFNYYCSFQGFFFWLSNARLQEKKIIWLKMAKTVKFFAKKF